MICLRRAHRQEQLLGLSSRSKRIPTWHSHLSSILGYMFGTNVLDKDGISALAVIAECATYLNSKDVSLSQQLRNIYDRCLFVLRWLFRCIFSQIHHTEG